MTPPPTCARWAPNDEIVDMPDQRLSLFVRLCLQNTGRLAKRKRHLFAELHDREIQQMEQAVQASVSRAPDATTFQSWGDGDEGSAGPRR